MRQQILAIAWAQLRISRNHFPRTTFGSFLSYTLSALWYLAFITIALLIMRGFEHLPAQHSVLAVSSALLAIFAYMQIVPIATVSGGWSLQMDKIQAFPIPSDTLFLIELILRVTSAPEMFILLAGCAAGLLLRHDVPWFAPILLLLFVPFMLSVHLGVRDFILHSFPRNRFREVLVIFLMAISLLPQVLVRHQNITRAKPYFLLVANGAVTPWHATSMLAAGHFSLLAIAVILGWNFAAAFWARYQFAKSLCAEDSFRPAEIQARTKRRFNLFASLANRLPDPLGALVEKEFRSLVRMPRFRVLFGMACIFSIFVFLPLVWQLGQQSFMGKNGASVSALYGLLLLADALLLNFFGFDRGAAQLYFATPVPLAAVIRAKNISAAVFVALQSIAVPLLSVLFGIQTSPVTLISGLLTSAMVGVFLLAAGNMLSVYMPRPVDPKASFSNRGPGKVQLYVFFCTLGMFVLVGSALLARWATDRDWVLLAVLGLELVIGFIVYWISLESAIEHALASQERIVDALSKPAAMMGS